MEANCEGATFKLVLVRTDEPQDEATTKLCYEVAMELTHEEVEDLEQLLKEEKTRQKKAGNGVIGLIRMHTTIAAQRQFQTYLKS